MKIDIGQYYGYSVKINTEDILNPHILIMGKSGSGKTVEAQRIMTEIVGSGGTVLALDWHHTLADDEIIEKYAEKFFTQRNVINVSQDGIKCHLLDQVTNKYGISEDERGVILSAAEVISSTLGIGVNQKRVLAEALGIVKSEGLYNQEGIESVDSVLDRFNTRIARDVRDKILPLTMYNVFRPGDSFMENQKLNIFRLSDFDLRTQESIVELILEYLWRLANAMMFKKNPLYVFVDEFQNLPAGKTSALSKIISEGRKLGLYLILATQQLYLGNATVLDQRIRQCGTILYFQPEINRIRMVAKLLDPDAASKWDSILRSLKRGEFVAVGSFLVGECKQNGPLKLSANDGA